MELCTIIMHPTCSPSYFFATWRLTFCADSCSILPGTARAATSLPLSGWQAGKIIPSLGPHPMPFYFLNVNSDKVGLTFWFGA